jgi:segregation and condensation protein A
MGWITEQFLEYVEMAREMNLRVAEDFVDMASLLVFIKSRMLLPHEGEDPRDELVERIMEYEKIRVIAKSLDRFPVLGRDTFTRSAVTVKEEEDGDALSLGLLFFHLLKAGEGHVITIGEIRPTLEEKLDEITFVLERDGSYAFAMDTATGARERVATVLAMLEITRRNLAVISQRRPFGAIILKKR